MKKLKALVLMALAAVLSFGILGCSGDGGDDLYFPPVHSHTYSSDWSSSSTHHWHGSTCGHTDQTKDKSDHAFPENWTEVTPATDEADGLEERFCGVCSYRDTKIIVMLNHNHNVDRNNWSYDETNHWHAADCGKPAHKEDFAPHTEDSGTVTTPATLTSDGLKTYKCTVCGAVVRSEIITRPNLYETPVDATTGLPATKSSKYIYFGVFPRTVLAANSTVTVDETDSVKMGPNTYCKGSDGELYAKVKENACGTGNYYTDGTQVKQIDAGGYRWFKVEPIKWKVLTINYESTGKALLLAEEILTSNVPYYVSTDYRYKRSDEGYQITLYPNDYEYSTVRDYLNGSFETKYYKSNTYLNKGFLQTAFSNTAQNNIIATNLYDHPDKIFLLSLYEVTNSSYGFLSSEYYGSGTGRIRKGTDFALANFLHSMSDLQNLSGSAWFLRSNGGNSGNSVSAYMDYEVGYDGRIYSQGERSNRTVTIKKDGIVPALCLDLK